MADRVQKPLLSSATARRLQRLPTSATLRTMYLATISTIIALAAAAPQTNARPRVPYTQAVLNNCDHSVWLTEVHPPNSTTFELKPPNGFWSGDVVGVGNSLGISNTEQYYSDLTPKFILGTSTENGILYWAVGSKNGNPFADSKWKLESAGNDCGNTTVYGGEVHACPDDGGILSVTLCKFAEDSPPGDDWGG